MDAGAAASFFFGFNLPFHGVAAAVAAALLSHPGSEARSRGRVIAINSATVLGKDCKGAGNERLVRIVKPSACAGEGNGVAILMMPGTSNAIAGRALLAMH